MAKTLLFSPDTIHGHIVEDSAAGPIYRDDGSLVDSQAPRPCFGCKLQIQAGSHDPCIANLPGVRHACCGHGLERTPLHNNLSGYVAFESGRAMRFSGLLGGERIRQAVAAALEGEPLPDGFAFEEDVPWWDGLSDNQRAYVTAGIPAALLERVREVKRGEPLSPAYLAGEAMWWDGLTPEQKAEVWDSLRGLIDVLVQEARLVVAA